MNSTSKPKTPLATIFFTVFIDLVGVGIIIPVIAPLFLNQDYGILSANSSFATRTIMLGLLTASYPFAQFFGAPILGALSDKYGRKKILIASLFGTFFGYLLFTYGIIAKSLTLLFLSRILDGFTGGNISIALSAISDVSDPKEKAKNFGLVGMAFGLGFIIGPYIGGKLSDPTVFHLFNFSTPFVFAATLCYINIIMVLLRFKETLPSSRHVELSLTTGFKNIAKALKMPGLRTTFIAIFFFTFGFNFFTQFFQVFLIEKFHFTQGQIGDLFAYIGIWIAFSQGFITRGLSKKMAPAKILSFSLLFLGIALFALLLPSQAIYLYCVLPFVAIFNGLSQPNSTAVVSSLADKTMQGEILGINQSFQSLAMTIPPIIAGFIVSINRNLPITVAGISMLVSWLIFKIFYKEKTAQQVK